MSRIPDLGPVVESGRSLLDQDLTHPTGGLDSYPAFDDGFIAGRGVIAPEPLTVTRQSSSRRRDGSPNGKAFYADGASGIRYWFGHVTVAPPVGTRFVKGQRITQVSANHEAPHVHVGVDASSLIGKTLDHNTDYTHGAPTVRVQLQAWADSQRRWPLPIPLWFWRWAKWRLQGATDKRPAGVPARIPAWAWRRLQALAKARR